MFSLKRWPLLRVMLLSALLMAAVTAWVGEMGVTHQSPSLDYLSSADPVFSQLDQNHDGFISRTEAKRSSDLTLAFSGLDHDGDGQISRQEYHAFRLG